VSGRVNEEISLIENLENTLSQLSLDYENVIKDVLGESKSRIVNVSLEEVSDFALFISLILTGLILDSCPLH